MFATNKTLIIKQSARGKQKTKKRLENVRFCVFYLFEWKRVQIENKNVFDLH